MKIVLLIIYLKMHYYHCTLLPLYNQVEFLCKEEEEKNGLIKSLLIKNTETSSEVDVL